MQSLHPTSHEGSRAARPVRRHQGFTNAHRAFTPGKSSGFTLIELLVVIAIIAILAAILFPVFAQAREKARATQCLSNAKQIATAVIMYTQDYDENFPWGERPIFENPGAPSWAKVTWRELVSPYIKNGVRYVDWYGFDLAQSGVWFCPSRPWARQQMGGHGYLLPVPARYENGIGLWENGSPRRSVSQASLNRPAETVLAAECNIMTVWQFSGGLNMNFWEHGGEQWPPVWEGATSGAKFDGDVAVDNYRFWTMPRYAHNGTSNMVFTDGHVKAINKGRLNWCKNIYVPTQPEWNGNGDMAWIWDKSWNAPCAQYGEAQ